MRDLLVYVGVPFCASKCHFCYWVAETPVGQLVLREEESPRRSYVDAVRRQIRFMAPQLVARDYAPRLMYWGGGTASILSVREFWAIMWILREQLDLTGVTEATMECSPDSVTSEKLAAYREAGFDRISYGVQSFQDRFLAAQARSHRSGQAREAVLMAGAAGFKEINVDLMCGLPDEEVADFEASVRAALELPVSHVSVYPYEPVPGTVAYRQIERGSVRFDRSERLAAFQRGQELLEDAGLTEYSFGYFGRKPCQVDLAYYRLEMDWIGFGARTNSLLDGEACVTSDDLPGYLADPLRFYHRGPAGQVGYYLRQGLGTFDGIDAGRWLERTGMPLADSLVWPETVKALGWLTGHPRLVRDERGIRFRKEQLADVLIAGSG